MTNEKQELIEFVSSVPTLTEAINARGQTYRHGRLLVSVADRVNRNGRLYPSEVWRREASRSTEKIRNGALTGQAEHPPIVPSLLDQFLKFTGITFDESTKRVYAEFDVIPTSKGGDFVAIADAGVAIGNSTRGAGTVKRETREGREVAVIQDDYELLGIDVMQFGAQSVEQAKLLTFESLENPTPTEPTMPETTPAVTTVAALRESFAELVGEVEKPFKDELEALRAQLAEMTAKLNEAHQANENTLALVESLDSLKEAHGEEVGELQQLVATKTYLIEKAQSAKHAAMLTLELLKECKTSAEVDAQFADAQRKAERLIETALMGKGEQVAQATDANPAVKPPQPPTTVSVIGNPTVISAATGLHIPRK